MTTRRLLHFLAMIMIGKGFLIALDPRRFLALWKNPYSKPLYEIFEDRPELARGVGALTVVAGIFLGRAMMEEK